MQQAEPPGHVDVEPQFLQLGPIDGGHVDGEADRSLGEIIDEQLGRFQGDRFLRLGGRGAQVRRDDDVGQLQQRMIGRRRLLHEHVERRPGEMAGLAAPRPAPPR